MKTLIAVSLSIFMVQGASIGHDMLPRSAPDKPIALINADIYPVSSKPIQKGMIILDEGKIAQIGKKLDLPTDADIVDLAGKRVYPGLISSLSSLGLVEINAVRATRDQAEAGRLNPNVRAESAVNPDSELIPVTRANGVLIAHISPSTYGLIAGYTASMYLDGWTYEDMTIASSTSIAIRWPRSPREPSFDLNRNSVYDAEKAEEKYAKDIETLENALANARAYLKVKEKGKRATGLNLRWEALEPMINGEVPALVSANSLREIRDAVMWAERENIRIIIAGGKDAWRATDLLKKQDIPVLLSATKSLPRRRWESYDTSFTTPLKLQEAGVRYAIAFGGSSGPISSNERNLPYEAAKAVGHGLSEEEALKALTLYPAQILGIADRVGSLEQGKDATLIITNGDPLDVRTNVEAAYIQGRSVDLASRHTQLYEKYKKRYDQ
ncbi:MAG: amidohydrolase family protein [Verrucomicrobiota bacterium]